MGLLSRLRCGCGLPCTLKRTMERAYHPCGKDCPMRFLFVLGASLKRDHCLTACVCSHQNSLGNVLKQLTMDADFDTLKTESQVATLRASQIMDDPTLHVMFLGCDQCHPTAPYAFMCPNGWNPKGSPYPTPTRRGPSVLARTTVKLDPTRGNTI